MALVAMAVPLHPAIAQPTNLEVMERLVGQCLDEVEIPGVVRLNEDVRFEALGHAVVRHLQESNRRVYSGDTTTVHIDAETLGYAIEHAGVRYVRDAGRLTRHVDLVVRIRRLTSDGEIAQSHRCTRSFEDRIDRQMIALLEDPMIPETTGAMPPGSFRRRVVEPVLLAGATAVAVVLFFTLRSKRATTE